MNVPLQDYRVLLFDMGGTFLFDNDRFGPAFDYCATYLLEGGCSLKPNEVTDLINQCFNSLWRKYEDPNYYLQFPSLDDAFRKDTSAPGNEIPVLIKAFAKHEVGRIPDDCAQVLKILSRTHLLGLVSNIWAPKDLFLEALESAGVSSVFQVKVFSSDYGIVKPARELFQRALKELSSEPDDALFIGDSLRCDVEGAKGVGMDTVWVTESSATNASANFRVRTILDLINQCENPCE